MPLPPGPLGSLPGLPARQLRRILVVDDEPDVAESLRGLLVASLAEPLRVRVEASAEAASRALAEEPFDLVLCDYKLPGKTGVELLKEARDLVPTTRRVLITAYPDLKVALDAVNQAGVDTFIEKPFEPEQVLARVEELLDEKKAKDYRAAAFDRALGALQGRVERSG